MYFPKAQFKEIFIKSDKTGLCKINDEKRNEIDSIGMGICVDTMMQSYSVNHARGCWRSGNHPRTILGMYYLVDEEEFDKRLQKVSLK